MADDNYPPIGPIRRAINLFLALALTIAGLGGVTHLLFFAAGRRGWMLLAAGMMATLGFAWLWADYINADPRSDEDDRSPRA